MQIAPGHAMWHYLDDGSNARGQVTLRCYHRSTVQVLLYYILKFDQYWSKDKEMTTLFRIFYYHPS